MFKVLLCIPPEYDYNFPPLGTPALCAFLKKHRIATSQIDLNLKYRTFLLGHLCSPWGLSEATKKSLLAPFSVKFFAEKLKGRYYSPLFPRTSDGIFPYLPYSNNTNSSFYFCERLLSAPCLWRYLEDKKENTFLQFLLKEKVLDLLDKQRINLLGVSIISPSQAIASLTLGLLVKKYLPHIHVNIGGQWVSLYRFEIIKRKDLFRCFDSVIIFEGDIPLLKLAGALKSGTPLTGVPNLFLKDTDAKEIEKYTCEANMDELPAPDFDGLPLKEYDAYPGTGAPNLTYETSRGCYWSKCAYCVDLPLPKPTYRSKSARLVANDIKLLKKKYKAGNLMLGDPGMSPRQMLEVARVILKEGIKIDWWVMARLDPGFTFEIFKKAYNAGLRQINFGFESASDRICNLLHKGNQKERSLRIIRDCAKAGIKVDLQTMMGLPQEKFDDALQTVDFLIKNKKYIANATFNTYYLTPFNHIYNDPSKYDIRYINNGMPFQFFIPFKNLSGMTRKESQLIQELYARLLQKNQEAKKENAQPLDTKLTLGQDVTDTRLGLALNGEKIDVRCLYNRKSTEYIYLNNKEGAVLNRVLKGETLRQIQGSLAKRLGTKALQNIFTNFVAGSLQRRILVEQANGHKRL